MQASKWVIGVLVVVVLVILVALMRRGPAGLAQNAEPLKIGFLGALTGDAAAYGESNHGAAEVAVDEINAAGGVAGRRIELISEDARCNGTAAASSGQKLITVDSVHYIVGISCSSEGLALKPISEPAKVIFFTSSASNPAVSDGTRYFFRNLPSDAILGKQLAEEAYKRFKTVAVVTEDTEYAQGLRSIFTSTYASLGGKVAVDEVFPANVKDFRSQLTKVKSANPEAVFVNTQAGGAAAGMVKQMRELGLGQQVLVAYWTGPDFLQAGSWVNGSLIIDSPQLNPANAISNTLLTAYQRRYGKLPNYGFYAGGAYDAVKLIAQAVGAVGDDTDKVREYIHGLQNYEGAIGPYHFDDKGEIVGVNLVLWQVKDNKLTPATQ